VHPLELAQLLSNQMSCPWISLAHLDIAEEVLATLPRELALAHAVVPVHLRETATTRVLYVATDDPTDDVALAKCCEAAGMAVRPMVAVFGEVRAALARHYGGADGAPSAVTKPAIPAPVLPPTRRDIVAQPAATPPAVPPVPPAGRTSIVPATALAKPPRPPPKRKISAALAPRWSTAASFAQALSSRNIDLAPSSSRTTSTRSIAPG
jgi:type IV pilus assembly protein PilB